VLMDCQMPVMDGFEATRRLRADGRWGDLPVVAMTASVLPSDRDRCLAAGMNDFVAKPVDATGLIATVARWTGRTLQSDSSALSATPEVLDSAAALARMNGDQAMYDRFVARFREDQSDAPARIRSALDGDDADTASRLAHTLKGLAGSIGANRVATAAGALEAALRSGTTTNVASLLADVAAALADVTGVPANLAADIEPVPPTALSALPVDPMCKLVALLEADDAAALAAAEALRPMLLGRGVDAEVAALVRAVARYDFDGATVSLRQLAKQLDVGL